MRRILLSTPLFAALVAFPASALDYEDFELPQVSALGAFPGTQTALLVDETTGERARVGVGDDFGALELAHVDRDRVVLRAASLERAYILLPVHGAERAGQNERSRATGEQSDRAGGDRAPHRVSAPEPVRAETREPREHARGEGDETLDFPERSEARPEERSDRKTAPRDPYSETRRDTGAENRAEPDTFADSGRRAAPRDPYSEARGDPDSPGRAGPSGAKALELPEAKAKERGETEEREGRRDRGEAEEAGAERGAAPAERAEGAEGADPERAPEPGARGPKVREPVELSRGDVDRALADLETLREGIEARTEDGGLRIEKLDAASFFYELGLREGDLVRRVAGRNLDSMDAAAALYAHLARTDEIAVAIERGGRDLELRFELVP